MRFRIDRAVGSNATREGDFTIVGFKPFVKTTPGVDRGRMFPGVGSSPVGREVTAKLLNFRDETGPGGGREGGGEEEEDDNEDIVALRVARFPAVDVARRR